MKYTLCYCALALTLAGLSCTTSRPPAAVSPGAESRTAATDTAGDAPALPAGVVVQPPQSAISKLLGWPKPAPTYYPLGTPVVAGKKSTVTINQVAGNQSNTNATIGKKATAATGEGAVATVIEKKAGPAVVNSDSSTLNAVTGGGNLAAVQGDGNTTSQTKADVEPPSVAATIAQELTGPLGIMLAVGAGVGLIYLLVLWRKKKAVETFV
jgi:hypothetical protein